jgi:hypothetical protein
MRAQSFVCKVMSYGIAILWAIGSIWLLVSPVITTVGY